jgi:ankyrin repeat protein
LIEAIQRRQPLHVIQRIVEADPGSVRLKVDDHDDNWYPLHEAVVSGAAVDVVQFLANQYPQALEVRDKMGWLPLHLAVQQLQRRRRRRRRRQVQGRPVPEPESLQVIRFLYRSFPGAKHEETNGGWGAAQIAAHFGNCDAVYQILWALPVPSRRLLLR